MTLWILQWIVSLIGVFVGFGWIWYAAYKESWKLVVFGVLFLPLFLPYFIATRWQKHQLIYPVGLLLVTLVLAALLQRARLGYWAWPDVELS